MLCWLVGWGWNGAYTEYSGDILFVICLCCGAFFCFKQKTAYEMRISDWSSDVCSSDLHKPMHPSSEYAFADARELTAVFQGKAGFTYARQGKIGRASCRERVCQYV